MLLIGTPLEANLRTHLNRVLSGKPHARLVFLAEPEILSINAFVVIVAADKVHHRIIGKVHRSSAIGGGGEVYDEVFGHSC